MSKRPERLHLHFDEELHAAPRPSTVPGLNAHGHERSHRPDPHRERKRVRRALHDLEGWSFDEASLERIDDVA